MRPGGLEAMHKVAQRLAVHAADLVIPKIIVLTDVGPVPHSDGCDGFGLGGQFPPCVAGNPERLKLLSFDSFS
jgi:hypothetical protein